MKMLVILLFLLQSFTSISSEEAIEYENPKCNLPKKLVEEIAAYEPLTDIIIDSIVNGPYKGTTYERLSNFIDIFGNRMSGTQNLENAIGYMLNKSLKYNLENVHGEEVVIPHWVRGKESLEMLQPKMQNLAMLGLGGSVGTSPEGLVGEALVVENFEELEKFKTRVPGKIVVFNEKWEGYAKSSEYRQKGAVAAAKHGAVAALISSVTPVSFYTPHTGSQYYDDKIKKIPTACITREDAHTLKRRQVRGEKIVLRIKMEAKNLPDALSRNSIMDIKGSKTPDKMVIVSGHLDSWDVGTGAVDDGAGAFLAWNSLVVLKALHLRPKRTIRAVLWTAEEQGLYGVDAYYNAHKEELPNIDLVMESDEGTFNPLGLEYSGPAFGACLLKEVGKLFTSINATDIKWLSTVGSDITRFISKGLPGVSLLNRNENYFWYHHTNADTMDVLDSAVLDRCTALWAATAYIMADLNATIPKNCTTTLNVNKL